MSDTPTRSTKYYDEAGEVEVISSDNIAFRVPAYRVQASSGRSEERQKPIHLEDVTIECASVIELVFDMLYHSKDICTFNLYASLNVVKFLSKYEFKPKLELVRLQLRSRLLDTADAPWVFVRACELGDHELCGDVIKCGSPKPWADNVGSSGKFGTAIPGVWSLDPTAFSQTFFEYMSPQCMWALCRAFRKIPQTGDTSAASRKLMANGFVRLMKLRDGPKTTAATVTA